MKILTSLLVALGFLVPAFAMASATVTSATLNGASYVFVQPGDNITVSVTATLTEKTKWKGTQWGINTGSMTPICANTKNAKEGTRNNATGVFTETFTIKAPGAPGLYNANFLADEANNCGAPLGSVFQKLQSIRVGYNPEPPVIAAHDDITVQLTEPAAGSVVAYSNPPATDQFFNLLDVACAPASGSFFSVGNTVVTCTAQDSMGNEATPSTFNVLVLLPVPTDTQPPVIAAHENVEVSTSNLSGAAVAYALPVATDDIDGAVPVSCTPESGATFPIGTTQVTCSAQDAAGNAAQSSFSVIVSLTMAQDTQPPVIAPHANVEVTTAGTDAVVSYDAPAAQDDTDGAVPVSCTPASGSTFALGTTTVTCSAQDAAGNTAQSTFAIIVSQEENPGPTMVTMASQPDESFLCGATTHSWRFCDDVPTFGFTQDFFSSTAVINLGAGSVLGDSALQSVTIAKDENDSNTPLKIWRIYIKCYTDASYTTACLDWVAPTAGNDNRTDSIWSFASEIASLGKYWTALYTDSSRIRNFDGSSPVVFNPAYYYQLVIDDTDWEVGAYGSESLRQPYFVMRGITQ